VNIRSLGPGDDAGALSDLSRRAFGPIAAASRPGWEADAGAAIRDGRYLAAFDGQRLVAAARYHDMHQCWQGRWMPMAGVASVMVAPEDRGRGTGRALMTEVLGLIAQRGYPVSVLYPATSALYRSLGWEIAGSSDSVTFPARSVRSLVPPDSSLAGGNRAGGPILRRCGPDDVPGVLAVIRGVHETLRDSGPNLRDEQSVRRWLGDADRFCYLAPDGFLAYRWHRGNDEILVERALAGSAATTRAMWAIVASHSTIAGTVRARLGPGDPVSLLTQEPDVQLAGRRWWMLRVMDAAAAVAGRGFPPAAEATLPLRLVDPACPGNDGRWMLQVADGKGVLAQEAPAGAGRAAGPVALGPRGFAALYAGTAPAALRRAGLMAGGDPASDAVLGTLFAASPFLPDDF
jgi:predicted acetyltransferase